MAVPTLTDPVAGTGITAGLHATNNAQLRLALAAGLDASNWGAGKIFAPSKLTQEAATTSQFLQWNGTIWVPAGDWAAYTPAWTSSGTQPALGNGTLTGKFVQIGKTVTGRISLTAGSTTTFGTGNYFLSLPTTSAMPNGAPHGTTIINDTGVASYSFVSFQQDTTHLEFVSTGTGAVAIWAATSPFTFGNTDTAFVQFVYESV